MTQHTPGPWQAFNNGRNGKMVKCDMGNVAHCVPLDKYIEGDAEANARLIAAAPQYHEAVGGDEEDPSLRRIEWFRVLFDSYESEHDWDADEDPDSTHEMLNQCRMMYGMLQAAIAAATGETK